MSYFTRPMSHAEKQIPRRWLASDTRDEPKRRDDARETLRETLSGPREVLARDSADGPSSPQPPGGHHSKPSEGDLLDAVQSMAEEFVWRIAGRDHRRSADLLEKLAAELQEVSEHDRAAAKRKRCGEPAPESSLETARQILRGVWDSMPPGTARDCTASALALLEEVGR